MTLSWKILSFYFYPYTIIFKKYCSFKYKANKVRQEKATRMLHSRKINTVRTIHEQCAIIVRAMIKNDMAQQSG